MYKTVRHGENSLQYKILAQQEEGEAHVKRKKSPRSGAIKLIVVIILLIIGIIASAVLVPLILTNDFIQLTGTFQKFSVSTLRRSHSGNHVVVIAKKPYGWNAPHTSVTPRVSNASLNHGHDVKKSTEATTKTTTTTTTTTTTRTTTTITTTTPIPSTITATIKTTTERREQIENYSTAGNIKKEPSPTESVIQEKKISEEGKPSTTLIPLWLRPIDHEWSSGSSNNFIQQTSQSDIDPMFIFGMLFILIIIMFLVLKITITMTKKIVSPENEAGESKEDKARLLKASEHEEE